MGLRSFAGCVFIAIAITGVGQVPHGKRQSDTLKPFAVTVDQPAYVGEPIWIHAPAEKYFIRYPFSPYIDDIGCNRVELRYESQPVTSWALPGEPRAGAGILCGSSAPSHSPQDRLPLHVIFPILKPGHYSVRWVVQQPNFRRTKNEGILEDSADSGWTSFTVSQPAPSQQPDWLNRLLANPPRDFDLVAGDYIPALVAGAPDDRVLQALADQLYSPDEFAGALATSALRFFPEPRVREAIFQRYKNRGPSPALGSIVALNKFGVNSDERRVEMLHESFPYLNSNDGAQQAAAITAIHFIVHFPDNRFPTAPALVSEADQKILDSAREIIAANHEQSLLDLAVYLGILGSPRAHELLERFAFSSGPAAAQAQSALLWHPQPEDLPKIGNVMFEAGRSDHWGTTISDIPRSLLHAYGDNAVPIVKKAMADSPYIWVRTSAAEELVRRNDPAAFGFLLDAIVNHRWWQNSAYEPQLIQFLKDTFPADLPRNASKAAVVKFLRARVITK